MLHYHTEPARLEESKTEELPKEEEKIEEKINSEDSINDESGKSIELSKSDEDSLVTPAEEAPIADISEDQTLNLSTASARQMPLPEKFVKAINEILIAEEKISRNAVAEAKAEKKEKVREEKIQQAVKSTIEKKELDRSLVKRFVEGLLEKNEELKSDLMKEGWTEIQIHEMLEAHCLVYFDNHSSFYSYLVSKELEGGIIQ